MSLAPDSRWNYCRIIRVVDDQGNLVENERLDLPYDRALVVNSLRADLFNYSVREGDTWANVGARFFRGRSDLWWVIAEYSGVVDAFTELKVGATFNVPQFAVVMFDVLTFDRSKRGRPSDRGITKE